MATLRKLVVRLGVKGGATTQKALAEAKRAQDEVGESIEKTGKKAEKAGNRTIKFFRKLTRSYGMYANAAKMAAMGVGLLAAGQAMITARTALYAEQIERLAVGFNMTTTQAQGLNAVFMAMGGTTDDATDALTTLVDRAQDVLVHKNKDYAKQFKSIGISREDLKKQIEQPYGLLIKFMDKALAAKKLSDKIAVAARIFGDDLGRRLVPLFVSGGDSFKKYIKMFAQFNLFLSKDKVRQLRLLAFEGRKFMAFFQGLGRYAAGELAPILLVMSARISKLILRFKDATRSKIAQWTKMLAEELEKAWKFLKLFTKGMNPKTFGRLLDIMIQLAPAMVVIAGAFMAVAGSKLVVLIFAKLSAVGTALAGTLATVGLILEDILTYFAGGKSVFGVMVKQFAWGEKAGQNLAQVFENLKKAGQSLYNALWQVLEVLSVQGPDGMNKFEYALKLITETLIGFLLLLSYLVRFGAGVIDIFVRIWAAVHKVRDAIQGLKKDLLDLLETKMPETPFQLLFGGEELDKQLGGFSEFLGGKREWGEGLSIGKAMFGSGLSDMAEWQRHKVFKRKQKRAEQSRIADQAFRASPAGAYLSGGGYGMLPQAPGQFTIKDLNLNVNGVQDPAKAKEFGRQAGIGFKEEVHNATASIGSGKT